MAHEYGSFLSSDLSPFFFFCYQKSSSPSITGCHTTQRLMFLCLNTSDLISVKKRKKKLNVVWSVCVWGECAPMLIFQQLSLFTSSCISEKKSNWLKIYFNDTESCHCLFTETTAGRGDDYRISPCQKHHWSIEVSDAIYTRQRHNKKTLIRFSIIYIFRPGEKLTKVLN